MDSDEAQAIAAIEVLGGKIVLTLVGEFFSGGGGGGINDWDSGGDF